MTCSLLCIEGSFYSVSNLSFQTSQGSYVLHPSNLTGPLCHYHYVVWVFQMSWNKCLIWEVIPGNIVREGDRRHPSHVLQGDQCAVSLPFWVISACLCLPATSNSCAHDITFPGSYLLVMFLPVSSHNLLQTDQFLALPDVCFNLKSPNSSHCWFISAVLRANSALSHAQ